MRRHTRPDPAGFFFALAAVLAVAGVVAAPAVAQEPPDTAARGPEVVELRFEGAESLEEERLEAVIATRATRCRSPLLIAFCRLGIGWALERAYLDAAELERDDERLATLYEIEGYPDAEVEARVEPRGEDRVAVVFSIEEGEPIRVAALEIRGLDRLAPPVELPAPLPLRPGDVYALPRLDSLRLAVAGAFAERGRPYAQIEFQGDVDPAARTARLVLIVEPGPAVVFGETAVETEAPIEEEVVRERLAYGAGGRYRPSALRETERALYQLPIVERAVIEPVGLERGDTVIAPRVLVAAREVQAFQVEGTVSSTDCLEAAVFWANRYFLGGPRVFTLGVGFANLLAGVFDGGFPCTSTGEGDFADPEYFVEASLRQPWPGSPTTALLASAYLRRESAPNVYVQRGYGATAGVAREVRPDLVVSAQYSPQRNELTASDLYFCGSYGVCEPGALDALTEFTWYAPVELLAVWTPTGVPIDVRRAAPGERWRRWVRAGLEGAALVTGSEYDYARGIGEGALTRLFGARYELAGRTRVGLLAGESILPPQVRLFSGGINTVRGVAQNLLGPKVLATTLENLARLGCLPEVGGCPPGLVVDPDLVSVRPTGGDGVLEANLEGRYWLTNAVQLAAFVDFGAIRRDLFNDLGLPGEEDATALLTPGVGIRILTGFGPVRIDVGYDPSGAQRVPLLTRDPLTGDLILVDQVVYDPYRHDDPGAFREFWRRLELHVGIGQPF